MATKKKIVHNPYDPLKAKTGGGGRAEEGRKKARALRAKRREGYTWKKAVSKQKKKGEKGVTLSSLIAKRKGLTKGTAEYAKVQNAINKAYGSKKVHKATVKSPKKVESPKKPIGQSYEKEIGQSYETAEGSKPTTAPKKAAPKKAAPKEKYKIEPWKAPADKYVTKEPEKKQLGGMVEPPTAPSLSSYEGGGKVESNPYGWPSRDARNGGKK